MDETKQTEAPVRVAPQRSKAKRPVGAAREGTAPIPAGVGKVRTPPVQEKEPVRSGVQRTAAERPLSLDEPTERQREKILAGKPTEPDLQFSCPYPGCTVRISRITDPGVRYNPKRAIWFCGEDHRETYEQIAYG